MKDNSQVTIENRLNKHVLFGRSVRKKNYYLKIILQHDSLFHRVPAT